MQARVPIPAEEGRHSVAFRVVNLMVAPQAEARAKELLGMGVGVKIVTIGKKAATYFK